MKKKDMLILAEKCCLKRQFSKLRLLYFDHYMGLSSLKFNLSVIFDMLLFVTLQLCSPFHLEKDHDVMCLMKKENFETHQLLQINLIIHCHLHISIP